MFYKILVPLDRSDHSRRALDVAIQIAKRFDGKLTLVHVYSVATPAIMLESHPLTMPITPSGYTSKFEEAARNEGDSILADYKRIAEVEKVNVDVMLREGHTVQEIIKVSKEGNFGLIVMGARGVSHIKEMLLGSVTDGVMHHVDCPVLVVR